jgi:hypothetical protein
MQHNMPCCCCSQVVLDASLQLYFLHLAQTPRLRLTAVTKASIVTPYVWLSATILVAIKLLYGLGNAAGLVSAQEG